MIPSMRALRVDSISGRCSGSGSRTVLVPPGVVEDALREQADQPGRGAVVGGQRQVHRQHALAEDALADRHRLVEVGALVVELGDDDGARHADGRALLPQQPGRAVHAVDGGDHEQGRVRRAQAGPQVADEVRVPGGVEQVDLDAARAERRQRQRDRALLPLLGLVEVAHRGAVLDATGSGDRPGRHEQGLRQGGLAGSGVADQDDVADRPGLVGRRTPALAARVSSGSCAGAAHPRLLACSTTPARVGALLVRASLPPGRGAAQGSARLPASGPGGAAPSG